MQIWDGYKASILKEAGIYTASDLHEAGYTAHDLKEAGFTARDLKQLGYMPRELNGIGYTFIDLILA